MRREDKGGEWSGVQVRSEGTSLSKILDCHIHEELEVLSMTFSNDVIE